MPGQLGSGGTFEVEKLVAVEDPTHPHGENPAFLDQNEKFWLKAEFKGSGTTWKNMQNDKLQAIATFYAESIGGPGATPPQDVNFGNAAPRELIPGQAEGAPYEVKLEVPNGIPDAGIYRCGVTVVFQRSDGSAWYGTLGYASDLMIQVHPSEE